MIRLQAQLAQVEAPLQQATCVLRLAQKASGPQACLLALAHRSKASRRLKTCWRQSRRKVLPCLTFWVGADQDGGAGGKKKTPLEEQTEAQIASLQALRDQGRETWSALGTFLQQFAGKSKAAAIAAIAIQKGLSIAQIISNTAAAQMRALAELGPIAGPPVAAKMGLYGKLQAGLVAATGLAQAMGGGGGAGGASPSLGSGSGTTQPAAPAMPTQTVAINLQGDTFSRSSVEGLLEQIQSQLDRGGRLVFQ